MACVFKLIILHVINVSTTNLIVSCLLLLLFMLGYVQPSFLHLCPQWKTNTAHFVKRFAKKIKKINSIINVHYGICHNLRLKMKTSCWLSPCVFTCIFIKMSCVVFWIHRLTQPKRDLQPLFGLHDLKQRTYIAPLSGTWRIIRGIINQW